MTELKENGSIANGAKEKPTSIAPELTAEEAKPTIFAAPENYTEAELQMVMQQVRAKRIDANKPIPEPDMSYNGDWDKPTPIIQVLAGAAGSPAESDIICIIGNWWISTEGDLYHCTRPERCVSNDGFPAINYLGCYCIYSDQLEENDWVLHLTGKGWFDPEEYENFKRAYFIACKIAGIKPTKQIKQYKHPTPTERK